MSRDLKRAFATITVFFLCLFAALAYTLTLAFTNYDPPAEESYYEKGLDYQPHLDALRRSEESGWRVESDWPQITERGALELAFAIVQPEGAAELRDVDLQLSLQRPATMRASQFYQIDSAQAQQSQNRYAFAIPAEFPLPGYWDVELKGRINGEYGIYHRRRVIVQ